MMFFRARRGAVVAGALLTVRQESGQLVLEWPAAAGNCVLQESASIGAMAVWTTNAATPQLAGGTYRLAVSLAGGSRFYRLRCVP